MRKVILVLLGAMLPVLGNSQSVFDKFENSDKIGTVTINKGMISLVAAMADSDDEDAQDFIDLAKNIDGIKVFISENDDAAADMAATMKQYVKTASLEEMMRIKDADTNVKFYIKNGKDGRHVNELLMFVTGIDKKQTKYKGGEFETILLTMTGDIDLSKIGSLTRKMNLPKHLEKADDHKRK